MKLSPAATEYLFLMGQTFKNRLAGLEDGELLDKLDEASGGLTEKEVSVMNEISRALGPILHES